MLNPTLTTWIPVLIIILFLLSKRAPQLLIFRLLRKYAWLFISVAIMLTITPLIQHPFGSLELLMTGLLAIQIFLIIRAKHHQSK